MPSIQNSTSNIQNWSDYWNEYVPKALLPRLHAFELMMAPYAIAHMKIGIKLAETGYKFATEERARIYLTNALEPWVKQLPLIGFDALAHEAAAVNEIKRHKRFTVVIGNPPYSGISSNMTESAQRIVDAYKFVDGAPLNERKLWLQDDYVKFIRTAQTTLDRTGVGILGYITNHGYLDNPTFRGMRHSLLGSFQTARFVDLHGNTTKNEKPPDGGEDKNVFDIKQGVTVLVATKRDCPVATLCADVWGIRDDKYRWLDARSVSTTAFVSVFPDTPFYFFKSQNIGLRSEYDAGWGIHEVMPYNSAGFLTARDHFVIDFNRDALLERIQDFANPNNSDLDLRQKYFAGCGSNKYPDGDSRGWKLPSARKKVQSDKDWRTRVTQCLYRPFDVRYIYWADWMVDWPRPELSTHFAGGRSIGFCMTRLNRQRSLQYFFVTSALTDFHVLDTAAVSLNVFPWRLRSGAGTELDFGASVRGANIASKFVQALLKALNLSRADDHSFPPNLTPEDIFHYAYAVFHSPGYRSRYAEFLKIDFPRLPLTGNLELFRALARLGGELTALHLLESPKLDKSITEFIGRSKEVTRIGWSDNTVWLDAPTKKAALQAPGSSGFNGVPEAVWNFHIGGYQVCQKWLKDRKGRTLNDEDIAHYHKIVISLSETIRLMAEIDEVIETHGGWPGAFAGATGEL